MKILIVIPYLSFTYGGTTKSVKELAGELGKQGIKIDLVTTNADGNKTLGVPLLEWIDQATYRVQYFPCWHRGDLIFSLSLISWLTKHLKDYDLVHTNTVFAPLISMTHWLCFWQKVPYVVTPHGMLEPWALNYKSAKKQFYYQWIEKPVLSQANAIQTLAPSESENIRKLGLNQTFIIPNGIHRQELEYLPSLEAFYQTFPETQNKHLILFLGRIDPKKGLDLLAPAFGKLHQNFPETHLVIAGPDHIGYLPTVRKYLEQAECLQAVTFTGMLTGELKFSALAAASLYVAPSYSEGFSMSILEGMASGLPTIITKNCNFPEAGQAQAAYIIEATVTDLTQTLINCLSEPIEANKMGDRAQEFIFEHYTWDKIASKLIEVYTYIFKESQR
jgi:glycosyltransferase involved in cell wall biosynthesis